MSAVEDWKTEALGRVARITMGQSPDSKYYSQEEEEGMSFLQGCAEFQSRFPIPALYCTQRKKIAYACSILFSVRAPVGRINIADRNYIIGRGLAAILGTEVDQNYLEHYLSYVEPRFRNASQGSTFEAINTAELNGWPIEHPTAKSEQTKIAEILSTVDRAIEQTEALIAKQQRIKTGLMQDLLTRGIDEHGNLRSEKTHKFKDSSIKGAKIPESWKDCTFRHITKVNQGLQIPIEDRFEEDGSNRYKYITVQYLNNPGRYLEFIENPPPQLVCSRDDILFTRTGNTGQIITGVEGVYHNNFFKIAYDNKSVRREYLIHFLNWQPIQDMIIELAGTTTIPDLNHGDFYALPLFLPEPDEQEKIEVILSNQNAEIQAETLKLRKYNSLKIALMQDLLTGKKRVTALLNDKGGVR